MFNTCPGVTLNVPVAYPPFPPRVELYCPPCAPHASILIDVTPAGTVQVWAAAVWLNVCDPNVEELASA
jgi:hypothetical protein